MADDGINKWSTTLWNDGKNPILWLLMQMINKWSTSTTQIGDCKTIRTIVGDQISCRYHASCFSVFAESKWTGTKDQLKIRWRAFCDHTWNNVHEVLTQYLVVIGWPGGFWDCRLCIEHAISRNCQLYTIPPVDGKSFNSARMTQQKGQSLVWTHTTRHKSDQREFDWPYTWMLAIGSICPYRPYRDRILAEGQLTTHRTSPYIRWFVWSIFLGE